LQEGNLKGIFLQRIKQNSSTLQKDKYLFTLTIYKDEPICHRDRYFFQRIKQHSSTLQDFKTRIPQYKRMSLFVIETVIFLNFILVSKPWSFLSNVTIRQNRILSSGVNSMVGNIFLHVCSY
jgi:hypothetical protein